MRVSIFAFKQLCGDSASGGVAGRLCAMLAAAAMVAAIPVCVQAQRTDTSASAASRDSGSPTLSAEKNGKDGARKSTVKTKMI
jgi:hypothetical protein